MRHAQGEQQPCCLLPCVVYSSHLVAHMRKHNYSVGGTLSGGQVTGGRSPPAGVWGIPGPLPSSSLAAGGMHRVPEDLYKKRKKKIIYPDNACVEKRSMTRKVTAYC